jgi:DNA-binding FrmR family transcriptional regulator
VEPDAVRGRLRRIEGQIQGVQRMLDEGRTCEDVLTQILAIRAAVEQVSLVLTERHVRECVFSDLPPDDPRLDSLHEALRLWVRGGAR